MTTPQVVCASATAVLAAGIWLLLPRGRARGRRLGALLTAVAVGLFSSQVLRLNGDYWAEESVFVMLAAGTVLSALGAVTLRSPVYCAIWFAMTLLGTAGLLMIQGAQFLGIATVVVYAGAILVTFLFVLMLAQPEGHAYYDRVTWEGLLSACTGAVLVGMLTTTVFSPPVLQAEEAALGHSGDSAQALAMAPSAPQADRQAEILHPEHMARLGGRLFSQYLVAVEVAGTLLLVALVGAVAIVGHGRQAPRWQEGPRHG